MNRLRLWCVAAVALCVVAFAGCSKISTSGGPGGAPPGTIPGVLRYADIGEPSNMNPILRTEAIGTDLDMFVMGFFYNVDDNMHYVPELATEVPTIQNGGISKDGLTITYHLRKGVKWQDGAPFTSRDPIFTWKAIMNDKNDVQTRNGWDQIASIEPVGDYEIKVHMKRVYGAAIATFWTLGGVPVIPAHLLEKYSDLNHVPYNTHPIGTGPFKFVKWVHGDRIELEANPDYWRGPPKLKRIVFKIIPNDNTILVQLKTHEIDAWFRAPSAFYPQILPLKDQGFDVDLKPTLGFSHFDLNLKNPIFGDVRVRQAIHYAINTQKIITDVSHGLGIPAQADVAPFSWAYNPKAPWFRYDPAKANQLLDEAGWVRGADGIREKNGQRLAFTVSVVAGGKTGEQVEALLLPDFKKVGIAATIKNYPADLFFANVGAGGILQKGLYDTAIYSWLEGVDPDDNSLYSTAQIPPNGQNSLFWSDAKIDAAEKGQLGSLDQSVRKKYFDIIQDEVATQSATDVLYFNRYIFVVSKGFHGFKPAATITSNWNSWEWTVE